MSGESPAGDFGLQEAGDSVMRMPLRRRMHVRIWMCACKRMKESRRDFPDAHRIDVWFDVRYGKEKGQALLDLPSRIGDTNVLLLSRQFREDCTHADERQSEDDCECQCFHVICFFVFFDLFPAVQEFGEGNDCSSHDHGRFLGYDCRTVFGHCQTLFHFLDSRF